MKDGYPKEIRDVAAVLAHAGFEAYLVGGCVRDLLLGTVYSEPVEPKDWDVATNAKPDEIQKLFPDSVYENKFGTVGVKTDSEDQKLKIVEVTTYRIEGKYSDKRHPDEVTFAENIEDDLSRRDFTVNAMALGMVNEESGIVDPFHGRKDLEDKIIRAVGDPDARFTEDALRILRAVRFSAQLGFAIDPRTEQAMRRHAGLLEFISKERIRDEFVKLIATDRAHEGVRMLERDGLLKFVLPELEEGVDVGQNKHHIYSVFEHNVRSLQYAVEQRFDTDVRIASLLHDVGKPRSKRGEGPDCTFYGHQVVGERMALEVLDRLHFPKDRAERIALLIREHMFVYDPETVTDAGARRLVRRVGKENLEALFQLREADRIGSGVPKAQPYRLRHLKFRIEKVSQDPISAKMLKVNGQDIMQEAGIAPGPKVGAILAVLLEEVLDDPTVNDRDVLIARAQNLARLDDKQLAEMAKFARKSADEAQTRVEEEIKKKYYVK
ncbi:MAG: CCA tRNA nucleotidyltransferase [Patescibacteria group bacterium]|nr:CCA tRNA nucleotidyltransferase [Patescibacteria group bacterium]